MADQAPEHISPAQVTLGAAAILVNACISISMQLGIEWQLSIAALSVLGYILLPIFSYNFWWLVIAYGFFMLLVGSWEATSKPTQTYKGIFMQVTTCIGAAAAVSLCYTLLFVIRTSPWWQAQYFIPILGMILGNTISGVSVGLATILEEFAAGITIQSTTLVASPILLAGGPLLAAWNGATCLVRRLSKLDSAKLSFSSPGREKIELLLSIGASRWEATREAITKAVKIASMPIINQMSVVGLVSIPGMMTGQILSGSDPSQAARYQMIIMFIIAGTTSLSSVAVITLTAFTIVDKKARIRSELLFKQDKPNSLGSRLTAAINKGLQPLTSAAAKWYGRVRYMFSRRRGQEHDADQEELLNIR